MDHGKLRAHVGRPAGRVGYVWGEGLVGSLVQYPGVGGTSGGLEGVGASGQLLAICAEGPWDEKDRTRASSLVNLLARRGLCDRSSVKLAAVRNLGSRSRQLVLFRPFTSVDVA